MTDLDLTELLQAHGSVTAAAAALGVPRSTLRARLAKAEGRSRRRAPRLTREHLATALQPPNNCPVKRFADSLDAESRQVLDEALGYDRSDLSARRLRDLLVDAGFADADVPGVDAINAHRSGARPCRCKG